MTAVEGVRKLFKSGQQFTTNDVYEKLRVRYGYLTPDKVYLILRRLFKRGEILKSAVVNKKVVWQIAPVFRDSPTKYHVDPES